MAANDRLFPPLTLDDAEYIVRYLERALEAHYDWIHRLQVMLVCGTKPKAGDLKPDGHLKDDFGRWYHRETNEHLRHHPDFQEIGRHHKELHIAARKLLSVAAGGRRIAPATYKAYQRNVAHFRAHVTSLLDEARELLRYTDPLTGLATRFAMLPRLDQERERVSRTGQVSTVGMADIDRFKLVNDTYGHNVGDIVLQDVARHLLKGVRRYDQVCRYGGEEFLILLPNTDPRGAKKVLDRLRRELKRRSIAVSDEKSISVSASFGVAALNPGDSILVAIDHADQAMYAAKDAGRNRVNIWAGDDREY
ncbi:MAG: diguanylate cyclase [Rhodospirillales bacterium]|jgi:diguanylate cyclase|nr:diguanylate cyclase [Rhodospirillales bacterium]